MQIQPTTKSGNTGDWFNNDLKFNLLYPLSIRELAVMHWTPLSITRRVVQFLTPQEGAGILDIGSGVGKFCLAAAHYRPDAYIYGIEQRERLVGYAEDAKNILVLSNVFFSCGNFTQLNLKQYNHFYLYNPFFENIDKSNKIDDSILYSVSLYNYYQQYLFTRLQEMPIGTRVATYCSWDEEIPQGYHLVETDLNKLLKFWIKK